MQECAILSPCTKRLSMLGRLHIAKNFHIGSIWKAIAGISISHFPNSTLLVPSASFHSASELMKIYTKTGDAGTSSLYSGERRPKDDLVFAALGDVDELNAVVGVAREYACSLEPKLDEQLEQIQSRLLDVGSAVATPIASSSGAKRERTAFDVGETSRVEGWIDGWTEELPPLTQFILPSGGHAAAFLHHARSICRRAERSVVPLVRGGSTDGTVATYLNRLSDYLFTAARIAAKRSNKPEVTYKKPTG